MKKRLSIIVMVVVLVVCLAVCFTACESKNGGGEDNGNAIDISKDYNYAQIEQKVNELAGTNGMYVKIHVTESDTDGGDEDFYIAMGVKDHVYYYLSDSSETYFDLRSTTQCDEYSKENNVWTKDIYYYGTIYTQAQMQQMMSAYSTGVMGWFGYYRAVQAGEGTKTTTTFLNRSCDKYTVSMNYYGAVYNQEVIIDKTTGICLKYSASASYGGEGGGLTIECTEFNTSWNYTLPQVTAANTETHGTPSGGGQGGGSGEGGQGGSGEGGQGGQGGQGGSGEGGETPASNPFTGKRFEISSINNNNAILNAFFDGAYIDLYNDGTFEMVCTTGIIFGEYELGTDITSAVLLPNLSFDIARQKYIYEYPDSFNGTGILFDDDVYTLPIEDFQVGVSEYEDAVLTLVVSTDSPLRADIPSDPNGYVSDSDFEIYQVYQSEWEYLINNKHYLYGNYTITSTNRYGIETTIEVDEGYIKESWSSGEMYYNIKNIDNTNHSITYDVYVTSWNNNIDNYDDFFDFEIGFIPAPFLKSTYYSESVDGGYYAINRFTYTDSSSASHTINNYRVWFNNSGDLAVTKIQYTEDGTTYTFNFTAIGTTNVDIPD